ncbi:MAG: hypothetical protein ACI4V1_09825, partial [Eubacteriales bacterium]
MERRKFFGSRHPQSKCAAKGEKAYFLPALFSLWFAVSQAIFFSDPTFSGNTDVKLQAEFPSQTEERPGT